MNNKPNLIVALAIFWDWKSPGLKFWMQTRNDSGSLNGKMEFPGGKLEIGESLEDAMRREVKEEVGIEITGEDPVKFFKIYAHEYEKVNVVLHCYLVGKSNLPTNGKWFNIEDNMNELDQNIPEANHKILSDLAEELGNLSMEEREAVLWK